MVDGKKKKSIRLLHGALFVIVVLASLFVHFSTGPYNWLLALVLLAIAIYFSRREKALFGPTIFFLMAFLASMLPFTIARLGLFYIVPLALYAIIFWLFPSLKKQARWFFIGSVDKYVWLGGLAIAIISSIALYLWASIAKPNLNDLLSLIPHQTLGTLIIVGLGFAILNSFVEESIYRGILWEAFGKVFGNLFAVALLQAAIFGIAHIQGFPRGAAGVAMAFVYGLLLAAIRHRARGLLAPLIVHLIADFTIYGILLHLIGRI